jgi:Rrf2 family protein
MLFSAKAEYACIAMLELAARYGSPQPVRLKAIADTHNISQRFLVQILLQLKGAGLVASTRGAAGGYMLTRAPDKISLADIINVIDASEEPAKERSTDRSAPPTALRQAVRGVWHQISEAQQRVLEETTLARLVKQLHENYDLMYQI